MDLCPAIIERYSQKINDSLAIFLKSVLVDPGKMRKFFVVFPHFALIDSVKNLYTIKSTCQCFMDCFGLVFSIYSWDGPGIGRPLAYMGSVGVISFFILSIVDCASVRNTIYFIRNRISLKPVKRDDMDEDVQNEEHIVKSMNQDRIRSTNLVLNQLSNIYRNKLVVNQLSIGVQRWVVS